MIETDPKGRDCNSRTVCETKTAWKINANKFGKFDNLLIECIVQTLDDLLGATVRDGLLNYLDRHGEFTRADMFEDPHQLSMLIEKTFGKGGIPVERHIIKRLCASLEWEYRESSNFNFSDQVEEARKYWRASQNIKGND